MTTAPQPGDPLGTTWDELNAATQPPSQEDIDKAQAAEKQRKAIESQACADAHTIFTSEAGARWLEYMRKQTCGSTTLPTAIYQGLDGVACAMLQNIREGENNFVRRIDSMIKKGAMNEHA